MGTIEKSVDKNIEKMQAQLVEWGAKIDELATSAEKAGAEAKADTKKRLSDLKEKRAAAQAKLDELKAAGSDKWASFKVGMETTWKDLESAFKELTH